MILSVPVGVLAIVAGVRMRQRKSRELAVLASILTLLPLSLTAPLGLIVGVWTLIILNRDEVRRCFRESGADATVERDVRREVERPAAWLFIVSLINWVGVPLIAGLIALLIWLFGSDDLRRELMHDGLDEVILVAALGLLVATAVMMSAALKMKRLEAYWLAVAGSLLAMVITPGAIIGLPVGIWSLVVLSDRRVREAFTRHRADSASSPADGPSAADMGPQVFTAGSGPRMLAIAFAFVTSTLCVAAGLGFLVYGTTQYTPEHERWMGWFGAGFGCVVGGIGGLVGGWNGYRHLRGRGDIMQQPTWTPLDTLFLAYTTLGVAAVVIAAALWPSLSFGVRFMALGLGGMATLEGLGFTGWRAGVRRAARRRCGEPGIDLRMIMIAVGLALSVLTMAVGVGMLVIALVKIPLGTGGFWGWTGGAFGCLLFGAGGLLGTWNTYRAMEGLPDWLIEGHTNNFDRYMYALSALGATLILAGVIASPWITDLSVWALELLGGVLVMQSGMFIALRFLMRRAAAQDEAAA